MMSANLFVASLARAWIARKWHVKGLPNPVRVVLCAQLTGLTNALRNHQARGMKVDKQTGYTGPGENGLVTFELRNTRNTQKTDESPTRRQG